MMIVMAVVMMMMTTETMMMMIVMAVVMMMMPTITTIGMTYNATSDDHANNNLLSNILIKPYLLRVQSTIRMFFLRSNAVLFQYKSTHHILKTTAINFNIIVPDSNFQSNLYYLNREFNRRFSNSYRVNLQFNSF